MVQPIVNKTYILKKFPGKGGWTYAEIPEIPPAKHAHFGWVRVNGSIDNYTLDKYRLMPMGNGTLFLPVKAAIRKKIRKEAGDEVHITLEIDNTPNTLTQELKACFDLEPPATLAFYNELSEKEKQTYLDWIYDTKKEGEKEIRVRDMMDKLALGKRFYD